MLTLRTLDGEAPVDFLGGPTATTWSQERDARKTRGEERARGCHDEL